MDLACACDVRYCSADAAFCIAEVKVGLAADVGTLQRMPRVSTCILSLSVVQTALNWWWYPQPFVDCVRVYMGMLRCESNGIPAYGLFCLFVPSAH